MSHITGTVQPVAPVQKLGPDFGPATGPADTWTLNFPPAPAPLGTKLVMLHFTGASLPANNRVEVDLGYGGELDVFTSADGTDFWTRPININALAGAQVPIRYITNGAATGGVQLDMYGRGERHTKDPTNANPLFDSFSNCDPFLPGGSFAEPDYAKFWFCNDPPHWENMACNPAGADVRNTVSPAVGMVVHVDANPILGFVVSTCTVTLVSPDTVITAGHCMANPIEDSKSASVIFNYQTSDCGGAAPGYHGRFFKVKDVIRQRFADGTKSDYCLMTLKVPMGGLGITPVPMRMDIPAAGEQVFCIHYPNGAVKKLSPLHPGFGTVASSGPTAVRVSLDISGGSSGSGLFDTAGRIVGVLAGSNACDLGYFPTATMLQDIATPTPITRDVMLVFDRSGSMSLPGTSGLAKIDEAHAAASLFVQLVRASTGNRVGLVSFSTAASMPVDFDLAPVTAANKNTLIGGPPFTGGKIGGLLPGGATSIGDGLNKAFGELTTIANLRNVLLFTDGLQNTPPLVDPTNTSPTDIFIDVIGYGTPASLDGAMLTSLATVHFGQYVLADTNLKLQKFFALAFGNIFEAGLLMDPEFVLPQGQQAAAPVPFNVCEEEIITVVVGWDNREAQLLVEVTTPAGATVTAGSPGVEASSSRTWTFLRVPLPHGGERDGTWKATVFRPDIAGEFTAPRPEVRYFINVVASGGAVLRRMPDGAKYYTGDIINPLVGLQYLQGGLPPNAKLQVTVARPDASVGNLLSQEKLGGAVAIDADTIPPRQATLMAIEKKTGRPAVGYTEQTFDLFDDIASTGSPEPAGIFGNPLKDLLTVEGNYTFHFRASYGDTCTATRELLYSVHVDPGIDASRTGVTVNVSGGTGAITVVPRDQYGNNLGPGRGNDLSIAGAPGTTVDGPIRDNGDGSYTVPVTWDPSSGNSPGVVIGQPGRPPVVVNGPKAIEEDHSKKWKVLFWLMLLVALILLVLWIVK
jgi:Trypsin-like peptidase domain/von Willebrand factor type A domain